MISVDSCMIIHLNVEQNIFVVIVYKINGKKTMKMPKNGEYVKFKKFGRKMKLPFMIYTDSILIPEDNRKQNQNESYTKKYQKHVACSCGYKLVCVYDKFSKPFKS